MWRCEARANMITLIRFFLRTGELALSLPIRVVRFLLDWIAFNPKLGPLRYVAWAIMAYVAFALTLVYVIAPIRGMTGQIYQSERLRYDAERWLATAIYDRKGNFVGTFDPRLDSVRDVNWTDRRIEFNDHVANPDHKSIPVREVPEHYWQCLLFQEDRYLGTALNPFGIDLLGVLKIPYSAARRSIRLRSLHIGVGGSTLPMQFARVIYKTPPHTRESAFEKMRRKLSEWWLAPVIYAELTRDGTNNELKRWAANHLWLAQRTGGSSLHGVEVTSQIVFGKQAKDLTTAEQFVLASAVNKPIILLEGGDKLNEVRLDRWRYIVEVRARTCAERLLDNEEEQRQVVFELIGMAGGPPDPQVKPALHRALEAHAPDRAKRAEANPFVRANTVLPAARFGVREQMKQLYGFGWRNHVRGVTTSLDAAENLSFHTKVRDALTDLNKKVESKIGPGFTLDPSKVSFDRKSPDVVIVAANIKGEIVRYYESGETAAYFGSPIARDSETGYYERKRDPRMLASIGKIISAIAITNTGRDNTGTLYLDTRAPERGLETCRRSGNLRRGRKAIVAFACSLNDPIMNRTAKVGQKRVKRIIDSFAFNMPPKNNFGEGTPPSTAATLGLVSGSPRRVHQMSAVVLASLIGKDAKPIGQPSLVKDFDYTHKDEAGATGGDGVAPIIPRNVIRRGARPLLRSLLQAPLCYEANKTSHGTLKSLSKWCAKRKANVRLHFAKTGTQVTLDPDATVDVWTTGGIQFTNGAAYSYVVLVGTGSGSRPWARSLHASQVAAPLVGVLLADLEVHAKSNPNRNWLPRTQRRRKKPIARPKKRTPVASVRKRKSSKRRAESVSPWEQERRRQFGLE